MTPRRAASLLLASLAALQAALILLPAPTWTLWQARFVALETAPLATLLGVTAMALARRPSELGTAAVGGFSAIVGALPFILPLAALLAGGHRFSPGAFLLGYDGPEVPLALDRILDPDRPDLVVDVYRGRGEGPRPFVVVVHGGSWRFGDKGDGAPLSRTLAADGITVLDVRYRLAPEHPFPAAIADVKCALGRAREAAADLGIDPARAALLGRSAGGQIALLAAYTAGDERLPPSCAVPDAGVRAVVGLYAPTDLADAWRRPVRPDVVDGPRSLELYLGGTPEQRAERYALATPQTHVRGGVPTLLLHGTSERIVRPHHATRLRDALRGAGIPVRYVPVAFADHGFDHRPGGVGEQLARAEIRRFLSEQLRP